MPIHLHKRPSGIYHLRGTVQGRRIDQSARTSSRLEAEQLRAKVEADLFREAVYGARAVTTFADAAANYMVGGGEGTHIPSLVAALGPMRITAITQQVVDALAAKRPGTKPATLIRQIYAPVSVIINRSLGAGEPKVTFRKPTIAQVRTEYLTPQQAEAWITHLPSYLSSLITFLLGTGCRISEALNLEWRDVSDDSGRAIFWVTKSRNARGVDLPQRVRLALPPRGDGAVFRNLKGDPWHAYDAINLMLKRHAARDLKLIPLHCHMCRHTWATWAYAATRDQAYLMAQGGWGTLAMVTRYTHVGNPDLACTVLAHAWEFSGREVFSLIKKPE